MKDIIIPVLVMTRNEARYIEKCVLSLLNTSIPIRLIVVDNASDDADHISVLKRISKRSDVDVIWCSENRWILNLDCAFSLMSNFNFDYFALTDGDVEVGSSQLDWLECLKKALEENLWLGKIGASISLDNIRDRTPLKGIYDAELKYYETYIAPDIYLAPVDTTLALYRRDIFVYPNLKMRPGHMSAIRPYYHVGRSATVRVIHHGWDNYGKGTSLSLAKVKAFCKFGAHINWNHFESSSVETLYFKSISKLYKFYWGVYLASVHLRFIFSSKIVRQNHLYEISKRRDR